MKLHAPLLVAALLLVPVAGAMAQTSATNPARNYLDFPSYLKKQNPVLPPYTGSQYIPFLQGNVLHLAPGNTFVTPDAPQELNNKTIDFNKNTILHSPTASLPPECDDTNGQHLNFTSSRGYFCGTSGGIPVVTATATVITGPDTVTVSGAGGVVIN